MKKKKKPDRKNEIKGSISTFSWHALSAGESFTRVASFLCGRACATLDWGGQCELPVSAARGQCTFFPAATPSLFFCPCGFHSKNFSFTSFGDISAIVAPGSFCLFPPSFCVSSFFPPFFSSLSPRMVSMKIEPKLTRVTSLNDVLCRVFLVWTSAQWQYS